MLLSGTSIEETGDRGEMIVGNTLLVLLNAHNDQVPFTLPDIEPDQRWHRVCDTISTHLPVESYLPGVTYPLEGRSVAIFKVIPPVRERRRMFPTNVFREALSVVKSSAPDALSIQEAEAVEPASAVPES